MSCTDIRSFNVRDCHADVELDDISPLSERARSLMVRSRDAAILRTAFPTVAGAIEMMSALDYHHSNFMTHFGQIGSHESIFSDLDHEAVAYLNRMGQFHTFGKSDAVKSILPDSLSLLPKLSQLMIFRNKHTAHRAADAPRKDDTDGFLTYYGGCVGLSFGRMWQPRPGHPEGWLQDWLDRRGNLVAAGELDREQAKHCYLAYQTEDVTKSIAVRFLPERDHEEIIAQAFLLMGALLAS